MPSPLERAPERARGFTLVELSMALSIVAGMLVATAAALHRRAAELAGGERADASEHAVGEVLADIGRRLENGGCRIPSTTLGAALGGHRSEAVRLTDVSGLPPAGTIIVDPGTPNEERIGYAAVDRGSNTLLQVERGLPGQDHAAGTRLHDIG